MIKYERYQKMSEQQKEEYTFRFKKYHEFNMPIDLKWLIIMYFIMGFFVFTSWIMFKIPPEGYEDKALIFFNYGMKMGAVISFMILIETIIWLIITIKGFIKENKWLKERGI